MNNRKNINTLFMKYILGEATEDERTELNARADKEELDRILDSSDLAERYRIYDSIEIFRLKRSGHMKHIVLDLEMNGVPKDNKEAFESSHMEIIEIGLKILKIKLI